MADNRTGYPPQDTGRRPVDDGQSVVMKPMRYGGSAGRQNGSSGRQNTGFGYTVAQNPAERQVTGQQPPYATGAQPVRQVTGQQSPYSTGSQPVRQMTGQQPPYSTGSQPVQTPPQSTGTHPVQDPGSVSPFDTIGFDPSLAAVRSEKLINHDDPFFEPFDENKKEAEVKKPLDPRVRLGITWGSVAATLVICFVVVFAIFQVNRIDVVGNGQVSAADVVALSGISVGDSMFSVDLDKARDGINTNRYLVLDKIEKRMPNTILISVHERERAAVMNYCGLYYTIDSHGMVLQESDLPIDAAGLMIISGVDVSSQNGCALGRQLSTRNPLQLSVIREVIVQLRVLRSEGEITRFTVSDVNGLLMETREGYSVRLGDYNHLHAKLKALMCTKAELNARNVGLGTIDVSTPERPTFLPEEKEQ